MNTIKVFDGFVTLRNIAGPTRRADKPFDADDVDPANSARMSFGQMDSGRTREQDLRLAEYLMKNRHSTPMEMIQVWMEFKLPIFVARQFVRHRTCLTGDTVISFDLPRGKSNGSRFRHHPVTLERLYENWVNGTTLTTRWGSEVAIEQKSRIGNMRIRCYDELTGSVTNSKILDVWCAGYKPVYEVTFDDGSTLKATADHEVYTKAGWLPLHSAQGVSFAKAWQCGHASRALAPDVNEAEEEWRWVPGHEGRYSVSSEGRVATHITTRNKLLKEPKIKKQVIMPSGSGYFVVSLSEGGKTFTRLVHRLVLEAFIGLRPPGSEGRHLNSNSLDNRIRNLIWGTAKENQSDRMTAVSRHGMTIRWKNPVKMVLQGIEKVYDIAVADYPNFFANNTLVHNCSLNEISARYTKLPEEWYIPELDVICGKAESNKQGRSDTQHPDAVQFQRALNAQCEESYARYTDALDKGIAPELARLFLHVNHYTHWLSSMNLHNVMHFLSLRRHPHAQYEARVYAGAVLTLLDGVVPELMTLYRRYYV